MADLILCAELAECPASGCGYWRCPRRRCRFDHRQPLEATLRSAAPSGPHDEWPRTRTHWGEAWICSWIDSSESNRNGRYRLSCDLQCGNRLLAGHGGKCFEKLVQRVASLEVVERLWSGTRVPTNTGVPPIRSGSECTTSREFVMDW